MIYPKIPYSDIPVISIIIQCQNNIETLPNAVQCIFNQGISDFEIIIIDNNSTDNTWNWLIEQKKEEKRIRTFNLSETDPESLRHFAIKQCKGEYVAFLNPNDEWLPMKILKQYEYLEKNKNVMMCFSNYAYSHENTSITHHDVFPSSSLYKKIPTDYYILDDFDTTLISDNSINTSTILVRKKALLNATNTETKIKNGCDLWCKVSRLGDIAFSNKIETKYTVKNNIKSIKIYYQLLKLRHIINTYRISTSYNSNVILIKYMAISDNVNDTHHIKTDTLFTTLTHRLKAYN